MISADENTTTSQAATNALPIDGVRFRTIVFWSALIVIGLIELCLVFSIIRWNQGKFTYTLDDAYIALALSNQIRHGHYGLNAAEPSAPSSSILYPFLEAPASGTPIHPYLPLIVNTLAMFATIAIIQRFLNYMCLARDRFGIVVQGIALVLFAVCFNLIGVIFTGLEHSLHIAVTVACIYGLALFFESGRMPIWLPAIIVVAPLLRYEGLAMSVGSILVIALRNRKWTALGQLAMVILTVGGFSVFLVSLKLAPLPSSVLVKSDVAAVGIGAVKLGLFMPILRNARSMSQDPIGLILLLIGVAAAVPCLMELPAKPWKWTSRGLMSLVLLAMIWGHAAAGSFGWFYRYEDYLVVGTALIGIYMSKNGVRKVLLNKNGRLLSVCTGAVVFLILTSRYVIGTSEVPNAANNIYEQQFQMHRFVTDFYKAPVAVGDLGVVSYNNPNYVLDLGGLSSAQARAIMLRNGSGAEYEALIRAGGVKLVIISEAVAQSFAMFQDQSTKIATLTISRKPVNVDPNVGFYVMDDKIASDIRQELRTFACDLPPGVKLVIRGAISQNDKCQQKN